MPLSSLLAIRWSTVGAGLSRKRTFKVYSLAAQNTARSTKRCERANLWWGSTWVRSVSFESQLRKLPKVNSPDLFHAVYFVFITYTPSQSAAGALS